MSPDRPAERAIFYFALPRLAARSTGRSSARGTKSWWEANVAGASIFTISYLSAWTIVRPTSSFWLTALMVIALAIAAWIALPVLFYINSCVIRLCRRVGIFRDLPTDRVQSIFICAETTVFALGLWWAGGWLAMIAAIWWIGVALNLASAVVLAVIDGTRANAQ